MARLPVPGGDDNEWGTILNEFLAIEHNIDGTLKPNGSLGTKYTLPSGGIPGNDIASGAITDSKVAANAAIAQTKIQNLTSDLTNKANVNHTHNAATTTAAGFMSTQDKTKLDGFPHITVSATAPDSPNVGDVWIDIS